MTENLKFKFDSPVTRSGPVPTWREKHVGDQFQFQGSPELSYTCQRKGKTEAHDAQTTKQHQAAFFPPSVQRDRRTVP